MLNHALANDPENAQLKVTIAQIVHAQGDTESALALLDSLDEEGAKLEAAIKLRAEINLAAQLADLPPLDEIEQRLATNPKDLEALTRWNACSPSCASTAGSRTMPAVKVCSSFSTCSAASIRACRNTAANCSRFYTNSL
jgi:hypothetical protein